MQSTLSDTRQIYVRETAIIPRFAEENPGAREGEEQQLKFRLWLNKDPSVGQEVRDNERAHAHLNRTIALDAELKVLHVLKTSNRMNI